MVFVFALLDESGCSLYRRLSAVLNAALTTNVWKPWTHYHSVSVSLEWKFHISEFSQLQNHSGVVVSVAGKLKESKNNQIPPNTTTGPQHSADQNLTRKFHVYLSRLYRNTEPVCVLVRIRPGSTENPHQWTNTAVCQDAELDDCNQNHTHLAGLIKGFWINSDPQRFIFLRLKSSLEFLGYSSSQDSSFQSNFHLILRHGQNPVI